MAGTVTDPAGVAPQTCQATAVLGNNENEHRRSAVPSRLQTGFRYSSVGWLPAIGLSPSFL
jgi:hypothetical protein